LLRHFFILPLRFKTITQIAWRQIITSSSLYSYDAGLRGCDW